MNPVNEIECPSCHGTGEWETVLMGVKDVTHWLLLGNIGHVLMQSESHWHTTACGTWTPNGEVVTDRPARKCKKCMELIPKLRRSTPNDKAEPLPPDSERGRH